MESLEIGSSRSFEVQAALHWNQSKVFLEEGASYDFNASGSWSDWYITTDPAGYPSASRLHRWSECLRRVPHAPWFALIGTVGETLTDPILIGNNISEFRCSSSGEACFFANDVWLLYWNNSGSIQVTITRTQ